MKNMILEREPLYLKLKKQLLVDIERENRQMLLNEKELMSRYGVSRNTLRRAVAELTRENILRPVQGIGTLIYPVPEIKENSRILLVCDRLMLAYQQEIFNKLLFALNNRVLLTNVLMLDKEDVDLARFDDALKGCDAVIVDQLCSFSPVILEHVRLTGKKLICLRWRPVDPDLAFVTDDVESGFYKLARHLLELGHRRIRVVVNADDRCRMDGIRRAYREFGLEFPEEHRISCGIGTRADGFRGTRRLLAENDDFTAIMGNSDLTALGIMEALLAAGRCVPDDVSVTGFDNLMESAEYPLPLTTCAGNQKEMIQEAIGYLFNNSKERKPLRRVVDADLIVRASTKGVR